MELNLEPNIDNADDFYEHLIDLQRDLDENEVQLMNAALILIMANHIGDRAILDQAMRLAREVT